MPEIRRMQVEDLSAVLRNERRSYAYPWSKGIFLDSLCNGHECWLMLNSDKIIGHGVASMAAGESHLLNVCVRPDRQGQGFGRIMVEHLLHRARARNATSMFLEVRASNSVACRLYEKLGFNETGRRANYYPALVGREDAILLAMNLPS